MFWILVFISLLWLLKFNLFIGHVNNLRISWFILYSFGYYLARISNIEKSIVGIIIMAGVIYLLSIFQWERLLDYYGIYCIAFHILLAIGFFLIFISVFNWLTIKTGSLVNLLDHYSFHIYIVHHVIIMLPFTMLFVSTNLFFNIMLILVYICFFSFMLGIISNKVESLLVEKCQFFKTSKRIAPHIKI